MQALYEKRGFEYLMSKFDRDNAFSMAVTDPDNPEVSSDFIESLVIGDSFYLFKANSIFKMLTADSIDPNRSELETKHSYEKISNVGCNSDYVARVIMQAFKIIPFITHSNVEKDTILSHVWKLNGRLLDCRNIVSEIALQYQELLPKCNQIISDSRNNDFIPALPKIPELDSKVRVYLTSAKLVLNDIFKFLSLFYPIKFTDRNESHFDQHIMHLKEILGEDNNIVGLLQQDLEWIRLLSECRNAIEHSGDGQKLIIENFSIKPGNRFSSPAWTYDLTKKLSIKKGPNDLLNDLDVLCSNMMQLIEDLIVLVVMNKLENHSILTLFKLDEKAIKNECPVRYDITLKGKL
ncbi:hypothetical protein C9J19_11310 [Photobacterium phosphoreum]|uniref:hypothetical protein n=1 Tax=Photobacterium phosphoreum TaxID=659 RepID=UPI000D171AE6|nr:hypothetical protein [Photobacterium phosphoreum]PSW28450.1 hypothetical protein C9J19_11310 [Photobacterium phosphoreum]